jgi:hypothetical protein
MMNTGTYIYAGLCSLKSDIGSETAIKKQTPDWILGKMRKAARLTVQQFNLFATKSKTMARLGPRLRVVPIVQDLL